MKKMYKKRGMAIMLVMLMVMTNCLTISAKNESQMAKKQSVAKKAQMTEVKKTIEVVQVADKKNTAAVSTAADVIAADHLDVSANLEAKLVCGENTYTEKLALTKGDFTSSNVVLEAKQGETAVTFTMNLESVSEETKAADIKQIHIGGAYPVGTKDNPVVYTFKLTKNVTFKNAEGTEITTLPVTFTATFNYWMDGNTCTQLKDAQIDKEAWKNGTFVKEIGLGFALGEGNAVYTEPEENPKEESNDSNNENNQNDEKNENTQDDSANNNEESGNENTSNPSQNEGKQPAIVTPVTWTTANITATKTLTGRALKAGEFTYEVVDTDGTVVATGTNEAAEAGKAAKITFTDKTFTYDKAAENIYTVREVSGTLKGVTYDKNTHQVKVTVSETDEKLTVNVTNNEIAFKSVYGTADIDLTLSGTISLDAGGRTLKAGEFTVSVVETDEDGKKLENASAKTVTHGVDGKYNFKVTYGLENVGTHYYKVTEVSGKETGMTYPSKSYLVKVSVKDNGDGTLSAVSDNNTKLNFTNKYTASGSIAIQAKTVLNGRTLKKDEFSYKLTAVTKNAPMPKTVTEKNTAAGAVTFDKITFDEDDIGKTYEYKISQVTGKLDKVTYDKTTYTVKVTVADKGNGKLEVKQSVVPTFTNKYTGTVAAKTGDTTSLLLYGILAVVSGTTTVAAFKKRKKAE